MEIVTNPYRGTGLGSGTDKIPLPSTDAGAVARLLARCPAAEETPLRDLPDLAREFKIASFHLKDESDRMGLGSFKALGAAYAIAHEASLARTEGDWAAALAGRTYIAASAGNHGLSVAAGARHFGAKAIVILAANVPESFASRLQALGAQVERAGASYEESMAAAADLAQRRDWTLLSDSSWPGYLELPWRIMEGYLQMAEEAAEAIGDPPTHIFLQAGVGGMAAAVAAHARVRWGDGPNICVVEPVVAPALMAGIGAGQPVDGDGPASSMGRLACKTASLIALHSLARDADRFITITEAEAAQAVGVLDRHGLATTPSGAAGIAPLISPDPGNGLLLGPASRALCFMTERAEGS